MTSFSNCQSCQHFKPGNYLLGVGNCLERPPWPSTRDEYLPVSPESQILVLTPVTTFSNTVSYSDWCEEYKPNEGPIPL